MEKLVVDSRSNKSLISFQPTKLSNLVAFYSIYYKALNDRKNWVAIQLDAVQAPRKWTLLRALYIHIIHIVYAHLDAFAKTGSLATLFQSQWNPIILEVFLGEKSVGFCLMARQSIKVFRINLIITVNSEQEEWLNREIIAAIEKYIKKLGGIRIIAVSSSDEMINLFKKNRFKTAVSDDVLYLDL